MTADLVERFRALKCHVMDDAPWYRLRDVFDALDIPDGSSARKWASTWISREHKRYVWQKKRTRSGKTYLDKRFCYIDRAGVERLLLRYCGKTPRHVLLEVMPTS